MIFTIPCFRGLSLSLSLRSGILSEHPILDYFQYSDDWHVQNSMNNLSSPTSPFSSDTP